MGSAVDEPEVVAARRGMRVLQYYFRRESRTERKMSRRAVKVT